jgi:hypothetical protein
MEYDELVNALTETTKNILENTHEITREVIFCKMNEIVDRCLDIVRLEHDIDHMYLKCQVYSNLYNIFFKGPIN